MPGFEIFGKEEREQVNQVLETGVLMRYNFDGVRNNIFKAKELESIIQSKFDVNHAQLTSSGTTALMTAISALGIGSGDEIIMPTFTFVASFEAVLACGVIPILVDIDESMTMNPTSVENAITTKTKAIMPVHMCGAMADMTALKSICKKHKLLLLEDACQAIGGSYKGEFLGTIGDAGCFSFDYVKTITCGEGGAVVTNNKDLYNKSDYYTDHGHDHIGNDRGAEGHPFLGLNFRISELNAAVGVAQINKLDQIIQIQRKNKSIIKEELSKIENLNFRIIHDEKGDNASFLTIFLPTEDLAVKAHKSLSENGVDACFYWYNNNWHYIKKWDHLKKLTSLSPMSKEIKEGMPDYDSLDFSKSNDIMSRAITSLIKLSWTEEEVLERAKKMAEAIRKIL